MKKTITQRFFLSLCLMIVGCLGGAGNSAWAESLTYSFSITTDDFNGTSYTANNKDHTTTAKCTTDPTKTMDVTWYSNQVMLQKSAMQWQSDKGYIYNKTDLGTIKSVEVTSSAGKFTTYYGDSKNPSSSTTVGGGFFKIKVGNATGTSSKVTITFEIEIKPELVLSNNSISFGNIETGQTNSKNFTLSGKNLTANSSASLTLNDNSNFSVSPTTVDIDAEGKITNKEITVTYAPTTTDDHSATLTIASSGISKEVFLTGTGVTPKTHYTVTWMVNGASYSTSDVVEGEKVATLPTNPADIGSKVFIGWTASTISGTSAEAPAGLFTTAEQTSAVTGNITYYAVFAKVLSSTSSWNRVKKLAEITEGSYVIKSSDYILPSTKSTSTGPTVVAAPAITSDKITGTVAETMIWRFTSTGTANQFYIKNTNGDYLYATDTNNGIRVSSTSDKWTFTTNTTNYFSMRDANHNRYCGIYDSKNWRCYTTATSNYINSGKLELYKLFSENTYSNYATTVATLADRNLSFGETTTFDVYDNTFVVPTLTGQTSGVTYASSNTSVATVNETGAITLEGGFGTTTITASAAEDEVNGYLAGEASYTLSVWPNSIAGIKTMITSTTAVDFKAELTDATITYVNDRNVYLQDADAAILMFLNSEHGLTAGKSYTGLVSGKATLYGGLREITSIDLSGITPTDNTIEPEVVTLAALNADYDTYESMYVKVAGVTTGTFTTSDPVQTTTLTQDEATLEFAAPSSISLVENNDYDFVGFLGKYESTPQFKIYEESQATNKGKLAAGLVFEQATYTAEVEEVITVKATNASDAAITYSVDDETNCLVDKNKGEFVAYAAGTYTITATCPATETHMAGTATCQVTVTMPASNISATTYYKKITSTDELVDGGQYVIVYAAGEKGLLAGESNVYNETPATVVFEKNGTITTANAAAMTEITFEKKTASTYYLNINNSKYIKAYQSNSSNLNVATGKDNKALWTIDFDASGNVKITSTAFSARGIMYSTSSNAFKNYAVSQRGESGYPAIQLYQKVGEMPIAAATGGITTYVADFAYAMPQHLVGHTVILAYEKDEILTEKPFRAGDEVPALTPLLIKSTEDYAAEETSKTYYPAVLNKTVAAYEGDNMLEYRRDESDMTKSMKTVSVYYYKLAIKDGNVGFYWGAEGGAAFKMTKPSTAYLTVPKTMSVQGFVLNLEEGKPTGITTIATDENAPIYNLQGIRMNGKNLPKGIYIQGGKKFMVK